MKQDPATLSGIVRDAAGQPVAGARVYLVQAPGPVPDTALLTNAEGRFVLAAPQPGVYEVGCSDAAGVSATARVTAGNGVTRVELRLP